MDLYIFWKGEERPMNLRQNSLLKLLVQRDHFTLIREYCRLMSCSEKTMRTDIKTINSFLGEHRFETKVVSIQGRGIKIQLAPHEKEYIGYLMDAELLDTLPDLERFYRGVITLLFSKQNYTVDSLAEVLYSNSVQIKEDLKRWNNMFYIFHLEFVKKPHLAIWGREADIRLFVLYYFYLLAANAMTGRIEPLIMGEHKVLFRQVLSMMEKDQGACFTSNALHHLEFYLAIMVRRIQMGFGILMPDRPPSGPYREIKAVLEKSFAIEVSPGELGFLRKIAESGGKKWSDQIFSNYSVSNQSSAMTDAFLRSLEARYSKPVPGDLKDALSILMETALRRAKNGMLVLNHEGNHIKEEYLREYLIVTRVFFDAPLLKECCPNDMEYTRFTMLLLPYLNEMKLEPRYRAGLIVNCSIEQAYFGKYKIEQFLPRISVRQILTEEEIKEYESALDFFISFNYITSTIPHAEISSMVNQNDIAELSLFLEHVSEGEIRRRKFDFPCFQSVLKAVYYPDMMKILYEDMAAEEAADLTYEEYERRFLIQKAMFNDGILAIFYDSSVKKQMLFSYKMEKNTYIDGGIIRTIHVLYVKDRDEIELGLIIKKLRTMV